MIVILVASMVQRRVFAQQIIIKGTVKDATSKKAAEYVNVVLQTADSVFVGGTITNSKGDFLLNKVYAGDYLLALSCVGYRTQFIVLNGIKQNINLRGNFIGR